MKQAIANETPVDIDLEPNRDELYSGICLKQNDDITIMLSFDDMHGKYDGFLILRTEDIETYRDWDEDDFAEIKEDNSAEFKSLFPWEEMNTFHDCLSVLQGKGLVSIFEEEEIEDGFLVGKIEKLTEQSLDLFLISEDGEWLETEEVELDDIAMIGFGSHYEKELEGN
ncbi:MAG: hypothetical protein R2799_04770 [Crocinitomicaceae bacterium]